jgi:hypothetical protein
MSRIPFALFLACLLLPAVAAANDGVVNELGTGIVPLNATDVQLERELVVFTETGRRWAVTADLHFRNPGDAPVTLRLGFPADYEVYGDGDPFVADLAVWVNGAPADLKLVPVEGDLAGEGPGWTRMYVFEATFPAKQEVQVLHEYTVEPAGDSMAFSYLTYVFTTGASWGGSVGEARFVFRFDRPPIRPRLTIGSSFVAGAPHDGEATAKLDSVRCAVPADAGGTAASSCHYTYVAGPTPTLELLLKQVEPKGDVHVAWGGVDAFDKLPTRQDADLACGYEMVRFHDMFGYSERWPELQADVLSCFEPGVLRNILFAARGYRHTSERYQSMFRGLFLPSDATFDEGWLTPGEKRIVEQLKGLEAKDKK